jgi:hypothetical protein
MSECVWIAGQNRSQRPNLELLPTWTPIVSALKSVLKFVRRLSYFVVSVAKWICRETR